MIESPPTESASEPQLKIELAQVCVVEGIWQDEPDHLAAFDETRLGASGNAQTAARGRGSLYLLLDVSGDVEGRGEVERELIEIIRREYAARRGSVTFGLSEAVRAANAHLFEINVSAAREARRMAGVSAVVLRGPDLYIAQAGPSVVYVEAGGKLLRYPAESDWFTEDQPLISPQGNASPPLGVRREFTCDLAHTSVNAGDAFVLATRSLTQLSNTDELAHAFADRGAEDIATFLEEVASGADLSALIAELIDPADLHPASADDEELPAVPIDGDEADETEAELHPVFAAQATTPFANGAAEEAETPGENFARRREERRQPRAAQPAGITRVAGGIGSGVGALIAAIAGVFSGALNAIDWEGIGEGINRALNILFGAVWALLALLVRLVLPGAPVKQGFIPRRASKEPLWLRGVAVILPLLFAGLAYGVYYQQILKRDDQATQLVRHAQVLVQSAENNADNNVKRTQLTQALDTIRQARALHDSNEARDTFFRIQDQLNDANGITVLYYLPTIATFAAAPSNLTRVLSNENDVYILDRGAQRVYRYGVNDTTGKSEPVRGDGTILKSGDKIDAVTVDQIRQIAWVETGGAATKSALVAVTGNAFLQYNPADSTWHASAVSDAAQWSDPRAATGFFGNIYLLDAGKNQILKYVPTANGYAAQSAPYLPANSGANFSRAVDFAIDGDVWILNGDGAVWRYRNGQRLQFELSGAESGLKNPVAIFTRAEVDTIYIADAGNQRIVEFDKNGKFVRQFKPRAQDGEAFSALKSLFANETKRKFFFINANTVYLANEPK